MTKKKIIVSLSLAAAFASTNLFAATCANYPNSVGMVPPEMVNGVWKIISTGSAEVDFDDAGSVNAARTEATLDAKAAIAKFFKEIVTSEEAVNKAARTVVTKSGDSKQATEVSVKESLKKMSNSASELLRGAAVIGDCYTPGKEYRVTVGIKPESIGIAESAANSINRSLNGQPAPSAPMGGQTGEPSAANNPPTGTSTPLNRVEGSSNSKNLSRF